MKELPRVLGFWSGTALIVGLTIGSGIFRKPPQIAVLLGDPRHILALWVAFGIVSLCGALTLAELCALLPRTGGAYVFLREAYGDAAAFVFGWILLLATTPAAIGALAAFAAELLLGLLDIRPGPWTLPAIGVPIIALLCGINILGTRLGSGVMSALTVVKCSALVAIVGGAFCFGHGTFDHLGRATGTDPKWGAAIAAVIWTYDGWIGVSMIAGEVASPERHMKRIIIAGMLAIVALYVGANLAYFYMVPLDEMATMEKTTFARDVMVRIAGAAAGTAVVAGILGSVLGALHGNILAKPRVTYAMAHDGLAFGFLGRRHPRFMTPDAAMLVTCGVAAAMLVGFNTAGDPGALFDRLTNFFVVVEWSALLFCVGAVFVLRRTMADAPRPFKTPLYPVVPVLFLAGAITGLAMIIQGEKSWDYWIGLGIAAAGFPVYYVWKRR